MAKQDIFVRVERDISFFGGGGNSCTERFMCCAFSPISPGERFEGSELGGAHPALPLSGYAAGSCNCLPIGPALFLPETSGCTPCGNQFEGLDVCLHVSKLSSCSLQIKIRNANNHLIIICC